MRGMYGTYKLCTYIVCVIHMFVLNMLDPLDKMGPIIDILVWCLVGLFQQQKKLSLKQYCLYSLNLTLPD